MDICGMPGRVFTRMSLLCLFGYLSDCPAHVTIESHGPGADSASISPDDIIVIVKRYMSDSDLCQARPFSRVLFILWFALKRYFTFVGIYLPFKVPMLALPQDFLVRLGTPLPEEVHPCAMIPREKRQKWVELAEVLTRRAPTESTQRTVQFLISLGTETLENTVDVLPDLPFCSKHEKVDQIDTSNPYVFRTHIPAMRFRATLRWVWSLTKHRLGKR